MKLQFIVCISDLGYLIVFDMWYLKTLSSNKSSGFQS